MSLLLGAWSHPKTKYSAIQAHYEAADKQAYVHHVHTQTEPHSTIRSHANQSQRMCEMRQVERVRKKYREGLLKWARVGISKSKIKKQKGWWLPAETDDGGKQWVRDAVYCLKWSGSCNELTIIHMSVPHTHLRLIKTFPALSLNPSCSVCHWAAGFVLQPSFKKMLLYVSAPSLLTDPLSFQCALTGETTAVCHNHLSLFVPSQKQQKHAVVGLWLTAVDFPHPGSRFE